jgi:hypothetical protein
LTILEKEDLEFARRHLERFEDTDFFPPLEEYQAIWADWDNFVGALSKTNVAKLPLEVATSMPVAKGLSTYRIVHQLQPLTCIAYTALVHKVAPAIEQARFTAERCIACSNRYSPDDGAFFSAGTGYDQYRGQSFDLALKREYVATADISDFFNQIYSHRVRGSIEAADKQLELVARDLEHVIHVANATASKGIPVGCDASRLIAEGIMVDIDQLIAREGLEHTRYVDDIRIFSDNEQDLRSMIETLSEYLYSHHRLNLNSQKTGVYSNEEFLKRIAPDYTDAETDAAMAKLAEIDPYGDAGFDENDVPDEDVLEEISTTIRERAARDSYVDHNLLKSFLKRCRFADSLVYVELANDYPETFVPVFHELAKVLETTIQAHGADAVARLVLTLRQSPHYRRKAVALWLNWVCSGSSELLRYGDVAADAFSSSVRVQARAAKTSKDLAWIRGKRETFLWLPPADKLATMSSFSLLGRDERGVLLGQIDEQRATPVELAVKRWVLSS